LSFYLEHYVGIFTALLLAAVIFVAVIIRIKVRKSIKTINFFISTCRGFYPCKRKDNIENR
jgi:hypothetical protein